MAVATTILTGPGSTLRDGLDEAIESHPIWTELRGPDTATDAAVTRRGISETVRAAVLDVDGIRRATITTTRRSVTVAATAAARDRSVADALVEPVTTAAQQRLGALHLKRDPRVRVRVQTRSS